MDRSPDTSGTLAAKITKSASKQTYYTIRFFADRGRVDDAYRAYGYFRWLDDVLDAEIGSKSEKIAFVNRQKSLLEACYRGEIPDGLCTEEWMLVDLVRNDTEKNSGLQSYLRNMMAIMVFDAERRGQAISQAELSGYSRALAVAVTEAMYYFIGHDDPSPNHEARYLAVTAAHIIHMLRDALEDTEAGYFNIPREYLQARRTFTAGCGEPGLPRVGLRQGPTGAHVFQSWPGSYRAGQESALPTGWLCLYSAF